MDQDSPTIPFVRFSERPDSCKFSGLVFDTNFDVVSNL